MGTRLRVARRASLVAAFCALAFLGYAGAVVVGERPAGARRADASAIPRVVAHARDVRRDGAARGEGRACSSLAMLARVRRARAARSSAAARASSRRPTSMWSSCSTTRRACTRATSRRAASRARRPRWRASSRTCPGARFGAVAFAGEPMSFPLTSDGAAIAQFFRQLDPNDMPVGGTATARALERGARGLRARSEVEGPRARHGPRDRRRGPRGRSGRASRRAARRRGRGSTSCRSAGARPRSIPEVGADGKVNGLRRDDDGKPLTTRALGRGRGAAREASRRRPAGRSCAPSTATTGIDQIAQGAAADDARGAEREGRDGLRRGVRVAARAPRVLLLIVEALIGEAPRRRRRAAEARG